MKILKFGGSSVADAGRIKNIVDILKRQQKKGEDFSVVFSAFGGVTDDLILLGNKALQKDLSYKKDFDKIYKRHSDTIKELIPASKVNSLIKKIDVFFNELREVLHGIYLLNELTPRTNDYILSFGELLSCTIITAVLNQKGVKCNFLDARKLIKTDSSFGNAKVDFEITNRNIKEYFSGKVLPQVITGFIASNSGGVTTTLGRGGSDYTASIFGAALDAKVIEIWTDVNGILTADPRKVKNAFPLKAVTYEEAMELSHFGAKVIHPPTMIPALKKNIKIKIKNSFNPDFKGTVILPKEKGIAFNIKGISSIDDISLIKISGGGMIGVVGIASRLLGALSRNNISAILITQGSSEHSICLAVLPKEGKRAKEAIEHEFRYEIKEGNINEVSIKEELSIIAVVGDDMINTSGVFGKVFSALGSNGINIYAVAQGSSELNMSLVIKKSDLKKSLNALHDSLFLSKYKTVNLYMVGPGLVGKEFLELLNERYEYIKEELNIRIKLIALANSKKMIFDVDGIDISDWKNKLDNHGEKSSPKKFVETMISMNLANAVFIDCTASDSFVDMYKSILKSNISIVTPNKIANSKGYDYYMEIRDIVKSYQSKFKYSTNVGAALPIITSLKDLMANGDKVMKIEGVLSGTLSFIFNKLNEGEKFSLIVKEAKELGYTEPDPRDDLNGLDFARKLLILIRESGFKYELKDIEIEQILSGKVLKAKTIDEFFKKLEYEDIKFSDKIEKLKNENKKLIYLAKFQDGIATVGLEEIDDTHPFFNLSGNDNIVAFTTKNYCEKPLIIRGAGAGARFTATGVFSDVLRIIKN